MVKLTIELENKFCQEFEKEKVPYNKVVIEDPGLHANCSLEELMTIFFRAVHGLGFYPEHLQKLLLKECEACPREEKGEGVLVELKKPTENVDDITDE